ncbi:MAG: hypothetical protein OEW70_02810 [candidate division WOR-3 bacterium]|nr:hypothetical protein [candidate division WOR-3 bacterium]
MEREDSNVSKSRPDPTSPPSVNWNGTDDFGRKLPAGVYFYRLEKEGSVAETKEFILLR